MTPYELGSALWRQRLLVVLVLVVVALAVLVGLHQAPKTFTATGRMTALPAQTGVAAPSVADLDAQRATLAGLASSRTVAEAVSADLAETGVRRAPDDLRRSVSGEWVEGTALVEVVAEDRDPQVAALVAQETLDALQIDVPVAESFAFTVTSPPRPPVTYSRPDLLLAGAAGILLAVVLACVSALVRDRRRATVDDGRVAERAAEAPLLAHVVHPEDPTALPALAPGTVASDGFRHLRRALERPGRPGCPRRPSHRGAEVDTRPVDLLVVAGLGGLETHVWVGANLAISLATAGHRVLLVDGRLTGGGAAGVDKPGTLGLLEVLAGAPLDQAVSPGPVEGLSVLPPGDAPTRCADALVETAFATVMERARALFDVVVVLPPPLQRSDDARIMAATGSLLLAVPEGAVSVASLRGHAERTRAAGTHLLGVVLVGTPSAQGVR